MVEPVWIETFGAILTGVATIVIALYTWRLWKLERQRDTPDVHIQWARCGSKTAAIRCYNRGKQADSVVSVVLEKKCDSPDDSKTESITGWEMVPPGQSQPVGEIQPGGVVDLEFNVVGSILFDGDDCPYYVTIGFASDTTIRTGIELNERVY